MKSLEEYDEHVLKKVQDVATKRFRYVSLEHPAMAALYNRGQLWLARSVETGTLIDRYDVGLPADTDASGSLDEVDLLQEDIKLPSLPAVVMELQKVVDDPDSSAEDVARVVSKDASLSAFLLRLVNSAFYSFPSQIDTISRAVTVVGTKQLTSLALGASVLDAFKEIPSHIMDLKLFWKHSIAVGVVAQRIAELAGHADAERFFVCGLLHDIGRLTLFSLKPAKAVQVLQATHEKGIPMYAAEAEVLGFDHAKLGGMLLRKWNFPFSLTMGVLYHHLPEKSEKFIEPHIVHLADIVAKGLGMGSSGEFYVPPMSDEAWNKVGLKPEQLEHVEHGMEETLEEMVGMLM